MADQEKSRQKSVVDEAMLRAFAKGQLDEGKENKIIALLEKKPELQAKVAAISISPVIDKMRAHSQVIAGRSLSSQFDTVDKPEVEVGSPESIDVPAELESLSEFRVIRELGRGGMGVVYLAENKWMGNRKEVLKVLNERLIGNEDAKLRFQKEIEITANLDHPAIVKSHSVRPLESVIVFSMEYVSGRNLFDFISENGKLPVHVACGIATDICAGLQHAMNKGAVHRDIKPSNIMLYKGEDHAIHAKILDFGLARVNTNDQSRGLTQDGMLLGTLEYIAPEQSLDANKADIRADIYSLGCTLYHMLVGHPPFSGSMGELILAHSQKLAPAANLVQPSVPVELADVVAKTLAKQADRRYQQPEQVAAALTPFLKASASHSVEVPPQFDSPAPETTGPEPQALRDTSIGGFNISTATGNSNRPVELDQEVEAPAETNSEKINAAAPTQSPIADTDARSVPDITHVNIDVGAGVSAGASTSRSSSMSLSSSKSRSTSNPRPKLALRDRIPDWSQSTWILIATGCFIAMVLGGLAYSILKIKTPDGTVVIENLPEDAEVLVDGNKVELTWDNGKASLTTRVGDRKIEVIKDGITIEGERVTVKQNVEVPMVIRVEDSKTDQQIADDVEPNSKPVLLDPSPPVEARQAGNLSSEQADWIEVFANGKLNDSIVSNHRWSPFRVEGDVLVSPEKKDRLLFTTNKLSNFRAKLEYRVNKDAEGSLILRCPNARQSREEGYSIGLTSERGWVYSINSGFHYIFMSARSRKLHENTSPITVSLDEWHTLDVEAIGDEIRVFFDGKLAYKFQDSTFDRGNLGIHTRAPGLEVRKFAYREIEQFSKRPNRLHGLERDKQIVDSGAVDEDAGGTVDESSKTQDQVAETEQAGAGRKPNRPDAAGENQQAETRVKPTWQVLFDGTEESFDDNWEYDSQNKGTAAVSSLGTLDLKGTGRTGAPTLVVSQEKYSNFHLFLSLINPDGRNKGLRFNEDNSGQGYVLSFGGIRGAGSTGDFINAGSVGYGTIGSGVSFTEIASRKTLKVGEPYSLEVVRFDKDLVVKVNGRVVNRVESKSMPGSSPITLTCASHTDVSYQAMGIIPISTKEQFDDAVKWRSRRNEETPWGAAIGDSATAAFLPGSVWRGTSVRTVSDGTQERHPFSLEVLTINPGSWTGKVKISRFVEFTLDGEIAGNAIRWNGADIVHQKGGARNDYKGTIDGEALSLVYQGFVNGDRSKTVNGTVELKLAKKGRKKTKANRQFTKLWDGKTIEGWEFPFGQVNLRNDNGILDATWDGANLATAKNYRNFHLRVRMWIDGNARSSDSNMNWGLRSKQNSGDYRAWNFSLGGKKGIVRNGKKSASLGDFVLKTGGALGNRTATIVEKGQFVDGISVIGVNPGPISRNQWHDVEFIAHGETIDFVVDGVLVTSASDRKDRVDSGKISLRCPEGSHIQFETFEILELGDDRSANGYANEILKKFRR